VLRVRYVHSTEPWHIASVRESHLRAMRRRPRLPRLPRSVHISSICCSFGGVMVGILRGKMGVLLVARSVEDLDVLLNYTWQVTNESPIVVD